jgi:7,8-dihydropterin-6-yl-methyl-4-(beta-D-ribofuranosyl)aminobenzene 5'-phosphate synthase
VDAGASRLFLTNLEELGEKADDIDCAVLSHAHYDHANGLPVFLEHNRRAKLYVRETTAADCYAGRFIFKKYIGIPKKLLTRYVGRIEVVSGIAEIADGAYLVPHSTDGLETVGKREWMYRRKGLGWKADDFSHEQSLVLETEQGLLIINSCSHGGVSNTIREVREAFPGRKLYGYIGGFHLYNKSREEILQVAEDIRRAELDYICTGHCTGKKAFGILKEELGGCMHQLQVGLQIKV